MGKSWGRALPAATRYRFKTLPCSGFKTVTSCSVMKIMHIRVKLFFVILEHPKRGSVAEAVEYRYEYGTRVLMNIPE